MTNSSVTMTQETMAAGGGRAGSGNPMCAVVEIGEPVGGVTGGPTFTVRVGSQATSNSPPGGRRLVTIEGTVSDPGASVVVNGVQATVTQTTFRAEGVRLIEGPNLITATATDLAGNRTSQTATVHLHTIPPARPTVAVTPAVTTATSYTLSGTKTAGTSVWINGTQVAPLDQLTTWSLTVAPQEGENVFVIVTKDAIGNESASQTITMVVDNLPPVITVTAPSKTNLTPLALSGTVDDTLTTVTVNGVTASRQGLSFQAQVPLTEGVNTVTVTATSPNGHVSTNSLSVILGTIPTITSLTPLQGSKPYAGTAVTVQAAATDKEGDAIEYRLLLDGQVLVEWGTTAASAWTPTVAQRGLHTIEAQARDGFGGSASKQAQVYVVRKPVPPP
ncbi:MAG: hypothetical protein HYZ89_04510 [Candidatus Omnitrophica bacterium]|nr:hypothetical protein [Candidatus Omnitrophota bacterium]